MATHEERKEAERPESFCAFSRMRVVRRGGREIVDYSGQDYREFWKGTGKEILHRIETGLTRSLVGRHMPSRGGWFLDLGCGYGRTVPAYYRADRRIVLVDYALENLQEARRRCAGRPNIHFVAADAYRLPFRAGVFEGGVAIRLFQHLNRPEDFLSSLSPLLAPGGRLLVTYFNSRNLRRLSRQVTHEKVSPAFYITHPVFFDRLCADHGLETVARAGAGTVSRVMQKVRRLERFTETHPAQAGLVYLVARAVDFPLGRLRLSLQQFQVLGKPGGARPPAGAGALLEILQCPRCGEPRLEARGGAYLCGRCWAVYPQLEGIADFRIDRGHGEETRQ